MIIWWRNKIKKTVILSRMLFGSLEARKQETKVACMGHVWFQLFLKPYNITHYKLCVSVLIFIYDLTILHITSDCLFLFLFQPYNITHYCQKNLKKYFSTLQDYTLLQTFCFYFFFNLTILHITVKKIWKNIFQHYKITHYFKCFLF